MTRKTFSYFYRYNSVFEGLHLTSQWIYLLDILCVDSWLGMLCEYNLISYASAFSIRPHPLKVVTYLRTHHIFIFQAPAIFFNRWPEKGTLTLFVFVLATDKDMYFVAGMLMVLSLAHHGAAPQFLSKRMYQWISQGYSHVRSMVELADVLPGTEIYTQLHRINDNRDLTDSQLGFDDMSGFLDVAGCTFPVRELTDKN